MELTFKKLVNGSLVDTPVSQDNPLPMAPIAGAIGAGRQLVTTTWRVTTAGTGTSVGDVITCNQVYDVATTPTLIATLWVNSTTGQSLSTIPLGTSLAQAIPNAQLGAGNTTPTTQRVTLATDDPLLLKLTALEAKAPAQVAGRVPVQIGGTAVASDLVADSAGNLFSPGSCSRSRVYGANGLLASDTATLSGVTRIKTYTYTYTDGLSYTMAESAWVVQ